MNEKVLGMGRYIEAITGFKFFSVFNKKLWFQNNDYFMWFWTDAEGILNGALTYNFQVYSTPPAPMVEELEDTFMGKIKWTTLESETYIYDKIIL